MGAPDLILELRSAGYSIKADGRYLDISPAEDIPQEIVQQLRQSKSEILAELQKEARREKVRDLLETDPAINRAVYADHESDRDNVILAIAIRHMATCEMVVPKAKFDAWKLMELIDRFGQTTH